MTLSPLHPFPLDCIYTSVFVPLQHFQFALVFITLEPPRDPSPTGGRIRPRQVAAAWAARLCPSAKSRQLRRLLQAAFAPPGSRGSYEERASAGRKSQRAPRCGWAWWAWRSGGVWPPRPGGAAEGHGRAGAGKRGPCGGRPDSGRVFCFQSGRLAGGRVGRIWATLGLGSRARGPPLWGLFRGQTPERGRAWTGRAGAPGPRGGHGQGRRAVGAVFQFSQLSLLHAEQVLSESCGSAWLRRCLAGA